MISFGDGGGGGEGRQMNDGQNGSGGDEHPSSCNRQISVYWATTFAP